VWKVLCRTIMHSFSINVWKVLIMHSFTIVPCSWMCEKHYTKLFIMHSFTIVLALCLKSTIHNYYIYIYSFTRIKINISNSIMYKKSMLICLLKKLNNIKLYTQLDAQTLNRVHKINTINFIWNKEDPYLPKPKRPSAQPIRLNL
jgi:hypothetical protein